MKILNDSISRVINAFQSFQFTRRSIRSLNLNTRKFTGIELKSVRASGWGIDVDIVWVGGGVWTRTVKSFQRNECNLSFNLYLNHSYLKFLRDQSGLYSKYFSYTEGSGYQIWTSHILHDQMVFRGKCRGGVHRSSTNRVCMGDYWKSTGNLLPMTEVEIIRKLQVLLWGIR